jgi:hypothetical protein
VEAIASGSDAIGVQMNPLGDSNSASTGTWLELDSVVFSTAFLDVAVDSNNDSTFGIDDELVEDIAGDDNYPGRVRTWVALLVEGYSLG